MISVRLVGASPFPVLTLAAIRLDGRCAKVVRRAEGTFGGTLRRASERRRSSCLTGSWRRREAIRQALLSRGSWKLGRTLRPGEPEGRIRRVLRPMHGGARKRRSAAFRASPNRFSLLIHRTVTSGQKCAAQGDCGGVHHGLLSPVARVMRRAWFPTVKRAKASAASFGVATNQTDGTGSGRSACADGEQPPQPVEGLPCVPAAASPRSYLRRLPEQHSSASSPSADNDRACLADRRIQDGIQFTNWRNFMLAIRDFVGPSRVKPHISNRLDAIRLCAKYSWHFPVLQVEGKTGLLNV